MILHPEQINEQQMSFKEQASPATPATGYVRVYAKADGKIYRKDDLGVETVMEGGGASLKLPTLTVGAVNADHTTIQGALDALGANGGVIYLTDTTYTAPAGGYIVKGSHVHIRGNAQGTIINADGATATTVFKPNANTYRNITIKDVAFNQTNATTQGIAVDFSAVSFAGLDNVNMVGFGTGFKLSDGGFNNTFYGTFKDVRIFEALIGVDMTSTSPVNNNTFINVKAIPKAGSAGVAFKMNNAQGNAFYSINSESPTGTGLFGVQMTTASVFDNNFYNVYFEGLGTGVSLDANTQRNNFYGGNIIASITTNLSDLGKKNQFIGVNVGGTQLNKYASSQFVDSSNASEVVADFKNNTSFAHTAGRLVRMLLLNGTDTSNTLEVGTAGTGLALQIQNTWATLRGSNYSTVGVSNDTVFSNHSYIRMNGATAQTLTGIAGGVDGKRLTLRNATANALTLNHENVGSLANNRILTPNALNYTVNAGNKVDLIWDLSDLRWVVLAPPAGAGGGTPAGATTNIQYNNAGAFGASADFNWVDATKSLVLSGVNTGMQMLGITAEPATPPAGTGRLYAKAIATKMLPKWVGDTGRSNVLQTHAGFSNQRMWRGGNTLVATTFASTVGTLPYTGASPVAPTIPVLASTNLLTQTIRSVVSTSATAGTIAYIRANQLNFWRGNAAGLGGFMVVHRFALSGTLQAGLRAFVGITDSVANPTNIDPLTSTTPGGVGLAVNANTGNWRLVNNITGTARTALDLGATFPVTGAGMMELVLYSAPNGTSISYTVTNLSTGATVSGTLTTNIPANTTFLNPVVWVTNNATAAAQTLDFISTYVETDY